MADALEKSFHVRADIEDVFRYLTDTSSWALWPAVGKIPGIQSISGSILPGQFIQIYTTDGATHEHQVVEVIPKSKVRLRLSKIGLPISLFIENLIDGFELEPTGEGTQLRRKMELQFRPNVIAEMLGRNLLLQHISQALDEHHSRILEEFEPA